MHARFLLSLAVVAALVVPAGAETVAIQPLDAFAESFDGPWTMDPSADAMVIQRIGGINLDRRAVMEFPLGSIPAGATILSATFSGDASTISGSPQIEFHGYAGDGVLEVADATRPFNLVAEIAAFDSLGPFQHEINPAFVQSLLGSSSHLGLFAYASTEGPQFGIFSVEFAQMFNPEPPTLTIEYIPEPATAILLGFGACTVLRRRRSPAC